MSTKKPVFAAVAVVGMAVAGAGAWWYQSQPMKPVDGSGSAAAAPQGGASAPAGTPKPVGVELAKAETMRLQDDAQAVGTLRSRQSVMLRPEVAGRITALGFSDGAQVRKGQLLVQLDDALQRAELAQANAQLAVAKANHERNKELVAQKFVAQRVVDESAAALQVVQAQVTLAQAKLGRMAIVAPFNGTLGLRVINVGDYVKDGADLVNLEDTSAMLVDFKLPERVLRKVGKGQKVEMALDALPGKSFAAHIEAIDPLLDVNGRALSVRAVLPQSAEKGVVLRPGMFARVTTVFGVNDEALVVPEEAIVPQGGKQYVIKAVEAAGALTSQRQEVTLGVRRQGKVEITKGVALGELVVVAGQQRLQKDGTPLRPVDLGKGGDKPKGDGAAGVPQAGASAPQAGASVPAKS